LNDGSGEQQPQFLGWLEILEHDVRAELVVLDACWLGDDGDSASAGSSFTSALSQSGARHVVAPVWPVSDAASTIWVSAFYSGLIANPKRDVAEAVRTAQLKLRETRMFRHPFYWAGLQSLSRTIESSPVATATSSGDQTHLVRAKSDGNRL